MDALFTVDIVTKEELGIAQASKSGAGRRIMKGRIMKAWPSVLWRNLVLAFVALVFSGCSTTDDSGSGSGSGGCVSTACKLAMVEEGTFVAPNDPLVDDYQAALDGLAGDCADSEERLGDMAVVSQEMLTNGGVSESLLSILQSVDRSIPAGADLGSCSDIFASYVVLRGGEA